jgi:hypothetical protein
MNTDVTVTHARRSLGEGGLIRADGSTRRNEEAKKRRVSEERVKSRLAPSAPAGHEQWARRAGLLPDARSARRRARTDSFVSSYLRFFELTVGSFTAEIN